MKLTNYSVQKGYYEINHMRVTYPIKITPYISIFNEAGSVLPHWHRSIEIAYVWNKSCNFNLNNEEIKLCEGELLFINSEVTHEIKNFSEGIKGCGVLIAYDFLKDQYPELDYVNFIFDIKKSGYEQIKNDIRNMYDLYMNQEEYFNFKIRSLMYNIIYLLFRDFLILDESMIENEKYSKFPKEVMTYIKENYANKISVTEVADEFGYSTDYFSRKFKKYTGMTYSDYVKRIRLYHARKQIISGSDSISDIAFNNGFADIKAFMRDFKKEYQYTPLKYRKLWISQ